MTHSFAFGLHLVSNVAIPGLRPSEPFEAVDVRIHLGRPLEEVADLDVFEVRYISHWVARDGEPGVVVKEHPRTGAYLWLYRDGLRFLIDADGGRIWGDWPPALDVADSALNLLGPVLGFVLRLRGITCLHASAVAVDGLAIALVGRPSAGKSTTAAALLELGYPLITEDVVPLVDRGTHYDVIPGYPSIRLWPRSVSLLYGDTRALPLLTPNRDKRRLDVRDHGYGFEPHPLPLGGIYYLSRRVDDERAPWVESFPSHQALLTLVRETYTNYALTPEMRRQEFAVLGRLTRTVPIRTVTPHSDAARLPQLCRAILDDVAAARQGTRSSAGGAGAAVDPLA